MPRPYGLLTPFIELTLAAAATAVRLTPNRIRYRRGQGQGRALRGLNLPYWHLQDILSL